MAHTGKRQIHFNGFLHCQACVKPEQSGGIVFTTIQKFLPEAGKAEYDRLSDRTNIVVIADTPAVFGQYVDIYDISQSIADGATVRIYYESRLAKVNLDEEGRRLIAEFDKELEEDEEITDKQRVRAKWTIRESARAKLMVLVKTTLNKCGYPPDLQQKAIDTVLRQAELLADYFVRRGA